MWARQSGQMKLEQPPSFDLSVCMQEGYDLEKEDKIEQNRELEEWERIYQEESSISLEDRKVNQLNKLQQILQHLHTSFGSTLASATKKARGESLTEKEKNDLLENADSSELVERIVGLVKTFNVEFYSALEEVLGKQLFDVKKTVNKTPEKQKNQEVEDETSRLALPKGFNKWDLKMVKLHESRPAEDKRIWVEFWTLKGISDIGEILFNPTKEIFYFKPLEHTRSSFALTDEHGRKATTQARNYYFRVAPNPPQDAS
jgi:hypothetical protein